MQTALRTRTVELHLPYPPSANHLWVRARHGMRKSSSYVTWLALAAIEARKQPFSRVEGQYKISIQAARPDKRRRDLDNLLKPISDLLTQIGAIADDSLCDMLTARWVTTGDGIEVRIEPVGLE